MKLKGKFILAIVAVLCTSYGLLMFYTSILQNKLVIGQAEQQARMLHRQILLTRQWVADHQGLFFIQTPDAQPNPYLNDPYISTDTGITFVKRNPAMVTRELSEYAYQEGFCWFRVTSLRPINPSNTPDAFESESLHLFNHGSTEQIEIDNNELGKVLRYAAPLIVKESCLSCHAEHGYQVGDIRGALSISVPISWADQVISSNNKTIFIYGILSIFAVIAVMYLLFDSLVGRPINRLRTAMKSFPDKKIQDIHLSANEDEIGNLTTGFVDLCNRLERSIKDLESASEKGIRAEKLAALGQLTAGIAHEINNPLGGMLNCVKSMQEEPENLELHDRYLPLLYLGLRRIEHTMRQLLNYGRVDPLEFNQVNIDEAIKDCIELLRYRLRNINIELDLQLKGIHCIDNEAIKQIIMNISLNSIQAMDDKGTLFLSSREKEDSIILTFHDDGPGINKEVVDKIFDPFFTTKDVGEGTGLGLAVTHSLVQRLDGNIEVHSEPGQGTTFTITLPINRSCYIDQNDNKPQ